MTAIEVLAGEASGLYIALEQTGRRATELLHRTDPGSLHELLETLEGEGEEADWLISRTIVFFGGRSALELLADGERERVMRILNRLRYGLCT